MSILWMDAMLPSIRQTHFYHSLTIYFFDFLHTSEIPLIGKRTVSPHPSYQDHYTSRVCSSPYLLIRPNDSRLIRSVTIYNNITPLSSFSLTKCLLQLLSYSYDLYSTYGCRTKINILKSRNFDIFYSLQYIYTFSFNSHMSIYDE